MTHCPGGPASPRAMLVLKVIVAVLVATIEAALAHSPGKPQPFNAVEQFNKVYKP